MGVDDPPPPCPGRHGRTQFLVFACGPFHLFPDDHQIAVENLLGGTLGDPAGRLVGVQEPAEDEHEVAAQLVTEGRPRVVATDEALAFQFDTEVVDRLQLVGVPKRVQSIPTTMSTSVSIWLSITCWGSPVRSGWEWVFPADQFQVHVLVGHQHAERHVEFLHDCGALVGLVVQVTRR